MNSNLCSPAPSQIETPNDKSEERDLVMFDEPAFENDVNSELMQHLDFTDRDKDLSSKPVYNSNTLVKDPSESVY